MSLIVTSSERRGTSFRPLAGSKVSEPNKKQATVDTPRKFPSPRGGVRFLNLNAKQVEAAERNGFRPLSRNIYNLILWDGYDGTS